MNNNYMKKLTEEIGKCDKIAGILSYGSLNTNSDDDLSDIDLLVFADSDNFFTDYEIYSVVSENTSGRVKPTIKTIAELSPTNYVTLTRRYIQHLNNVGIVLYQKEGIDLKKEINNTWINRNESKLDIAYKTAPSLIIRHRLFELYRGVLTKVLNDDENLIDKPSKVLWQSSIDVLGLNISSEDESKIIEKFYESIPCGDANEIYKIRERIGNMNKQIMQQKPKENIDNIKNIYTDFKNIIERDLWALNKYLQ